VSSEWSVERQIDDLHSAAQVGDFARVNEIRVTLDREAATAKQHEAVNRLRGAETAHEIFRAITALKRAFLDGTPGNDGWPRRF
jgi:hypothetical protein